MDLDSVEAVIAPTCRADVWPLRPGDAMLAGGTWLFSEPQPQVRRLVDLTALRWQPIEATDDGIDLAATCTLADVSALSTTLVIDHPDWAAAPLFHQCCTALLASSKIWRTATVGGNLCLAYPAGAMISLLATLDGEVTVWRADGTDYRLPITDFVTGDSTNALRPGELIRSAHLPARALRARTAYRKLAPSALGRSGIVVIGRRDAAVDGGRVVLSVTAATVRPHVFAFAHPPTPEELRAAHATIPADGWTVDAHGDPDWRAAMTLTLAQQVCAELT